MTQVFPQQCSRLRGAQKKGLPQVPAGRSVAWLSREDPSGPRPGCPQEPCGEHSESWGTQASELSRGLLCAGKATSHLAHGMHRPCQCFVPGVTPQTGAEPGLLAPRGPFARSLLRHSLLVSLVAQVHCLKLPSLGEVSPGCPTPGAPHSPRVLWSPECPSVGTIPTPTALVGTSLPPTPQRAHWDQGLCCIQALRNECLMEL